jgi:hypothetical protein
MKPIPSPLFLRESQQGRPDSFILLNDQPIERNASFFQNLKVRRARWNLSDTCATPDQQSCLAHLSDQFNQGQLTSFEIPPMVQQLVLERLHHLI